MDCVVMWLMSMWWSFSQLKGFDDFTIALPWKK